MGGRGSSGGVTKNEVVPATQRVRIPYREYANEYHYESKKVWNSYDAQTKTVEVDINPRIYEISKIMPDSYYQQLLDYYDKKGTKANSQQGKMLRASYAKKVYDRLIHSAAMGRKPKKDTPAWIAKAFNIAAYGKK